MKFNNDAFETVIIKSAGMEQIGDYEKHVVRIETTIDGKDHFFPSKGLINKLKEANADVGDTIKITKVAPDEKYVHGYFNVDMIQKGGLTKKIEDSPVGAGFAQKDAKMNHHEIKMRQDAIENSVLQLRADIDKLNG